MQTVLSAGAKTQGDAATAFGAEVVEAEYEFSGRGMTKLPFSAA